MGVCISTTRDDAVGFRDIRGMPPPVSVRRDLYGGSRARTTQSYSKLPLKSYISHAEQKPYDLMGLWGRLAHSEYARLFYEYPELMFSNRAALICTEKFAQGEIIGDYRVIRALPQGTLGRVFIVAPLKHDVGTVRVAGNLLTPSAVRTDTQQFVCKVVSFVTRMELAESVLRSMKSLANLNYAGVVRCVDIMQDKTHEHIITVAPYFEKETCKPLTERVRNKENLVFTLYCIGMGLRVLHSHRIYHYNLKPENIFVNQDGSVSIADAGYWKIFAAQTAKHLIFNGELVCISPEAFENDRSSEDPASVDIWGFGILMYRLAYGQNPFHIGGKTFEEIRDTILHGVIHFPPLSWPSGALQDIIQSCLKRDPGKRPTIMQILRHSFFSLPAVSQASPNTRVLTSRGLTGARMELCSTTLSVRNLGSLARRIQVRDQLRICVPLGKGRVCQSFLAYLRNNPTEYFVVKAMRKSVLYKIDEQDVNKIFRALSVCREISHPNLLPLFNIVDGQHGCFITQRYAEGEFLQKRFPPLFNKDDPSYTVMHMLVDVLRGLRTLYANHVSHNSLTPSNIFYDHSSKFVISDFGPLFLTNEDVLFGGEHGKNFYNLPQWVLEDLKSPYGESKNHLDIFCVGLLAASAIPSILCEVWDIFLLHKKEEMVVKDWIEVVKSSGDIIPESLMDFIETALMCKRTVTQLLRHPYLADILNEADSLDMMPLTLSSGNVSNVVQKNLHSCPSYVDNGLTHEKKNESCPLGEIILSESDSDLDSIVCLPSSVDKDSCEKLVFEDTVRCGLCGVELAVVVYLCDTCQEYVRCGKCALNDAHADGHALRPLLIHAVEQKENEQKECVLIPPAVISKKQTLEALEMQANLPRGALTKLPEVDQSNPERGAARLRGLVAKGSQRKLLPKASEMEESSWGEEIEDCRRNQSSELLLHRFDLTTVPKELFDPPLLNVVCLDLSYNKLKSIPHELSFLSHIKQLLLSSNELEELPDSLADLSHLERLDVSHNLLRNLPQSFVYLEALTITSLDSNDFEGIPDCLVELVTSGVTIPVLSAIYLTENHRITSFPDVDVLACFPTLKLALDNEPNVYKAYTEGGLDKKLPNVNVMWNKIYPDRIIENLYCGSLRSAQSQVVYTKLSISNLLTVGRNLVPVPPLGGRYLTIVLDDLEDAVIERTFEEACVFIDEALKKGEGCLVHCFAGMSRSAATVIAYLMMRGKMRLDEAYLTTRRGRPAIYPNKGFFDQLVKLDATLFPNQRPLDMDSMGRDKLPIG